MEPTYPILRHTLDKVRYFRNVFYGDDTRIRIIIGPDRLTGKSAALYQALDDLHLSLSPANQVCLLSDRNHIPRTLVRAPKDNRVSILIYFRHVQDPFVEALLEEYGERNCEIVVFESDPTLG
jgi:hypothetical protein